MHEYKLSVQAQYADVTDERLEEIVLEKIIQPQLWIKSLNLGILSHLWFLAVRVYLEYGMFLE